MGLFNRTRTSVGLDIGSGLIKLAVVSHGSGEPVLSKVAMVTVVDDAIVEGEVMDPGIVADAIRGLFEQRGHQAQERGDRGGRSRRDHQEDPDGPDEGVRRPGS